MKNDNLVLQETVMGVVPMLSNERKYSFLDLFLTTSGFSIATWCYTQGAYVAQYLSFSQMLINIFCFNIIWVLIECIPVFFSVRYGIDLWIWMRSILGINGVAIFATIISMANFGWYAVDANLFASSLINLFKNYNIILNPDIWYPIFGVSCVMIGTLIALGGPEVIKWTNRFLVTALLIVGIIVVVLSLVSVPFYDILNIKPDLSDFQNNKLLAFMMSAEGNVAFAFSWSTQALVLPRLCNSERKGYWATSLSYGIVAPFFVFAGGVMAKAMFVKAGYYESDPTVMLATLGGPIFSLLSLLMVVFANIGTQGSGAYVNCMIIKSGLPNISYKLLVILSFFYVSFLTLNGWVMDNFGSFISLAAYLQGPIIGAIVADYLFVKKGKIDLRSAYYLEGHNKYLFTNGFNVKNIVIILMCLFISLFFVYNPINGEMKSNLFLITTGSGFTAILGFTLYLVLNRSELKISA